MEKYIAAIDQGTSSSRCMIFDRFGNVVASSQMEHRQIYPQPGWVEHDLVEIWNVVVSVFESALNRSQIAPSDLTAIGITNQRETTVVWDRRTGKPYHNAIVWQDTRTAAICDRLADQGGQDRFRPKTGLPLATYFSGPKMRWMLDHVDGLQAECEAGNALFGTIDTWLLWNLTGGPDGGVHATDVTNASRTLLMNLHTLDWDREILETLGIPIQSLPSIHPSATFYGYAKRLAPGVPITAILGDQQAALFGQTCFKPGEAKNTYGTGCFMLLNTGTQPVISRSGLLTTLGYRIGDQPAVYCLEGSIAIAGALVQWLRDNLKLIRSSAEIETLARSVDDNGGVYFVPAFSGLFAPYWRSDARGVIAGLTRFATDGHIARAVLESTAYQTLDVLHAMENDSGVHLYSLRVDGGMVVNDLLMQFQADILDVPVVRPQVTETTALGAAYAAGLAVGFWSSLDELSSNWKKDREWQPQMESDCRQKLYAGWKKAINRTLGWVD